MENSNEPTKVEDEIAIRIEGKDYWLVSQFAKLTNKKEQTIRLLISKGNRIRKLNHIHIGEKPFICAEELFEFPFVVPGRPAGMGDFIEKFYLENGELIKNEELLKSEDVLDKCQ